MLTDSLILLSLLVLNGLLSMSETALISCRRSHIQSRLEDIPHAKTLDNLLAHPGEFISSLQIGITIISVFSGAYSGQALAEPLSHWFNGMPWMRGFGVPVAYGTIVLIMTYVTLLVSELVPKRIALSYPEHIALRVAGTVHALTRYSYFIVKVLDSSAKIALHLLGFSDVKRNSLTDKELQFLFQQGLEEGAISTFEHNAFRRVLSFGTIEASSIMTPRVKVVTVSLSDSPEHLLQSMLSHAHRYYPVIEKNPGNILGVIDARDFLKHYYQHSSGQINIKDFIQPAPIIIEDNVGPQIIQHFTTHAVKIALVVDEYGAFQGIITPYDVLESLTGPIAYVNEQKEQNIILQENGAWLCNGLTPIQTLEEVLKIKFVDPENEDDFNTLAGFMLSHFDRVPQANDQFRYDRYHFQVVEMDHQRIHKVFIIPDIS